MGEALISGAGGGTGKIYKWKRYEINSKTVYTWDKYSVLETTEYKWNKYDTEIIEGTGYTCNSALEIGKIVTLYSWLSATKVTSGQYPYRFSGRGPMTVKVPATRYTDAEGMWSIASDNQSAVRHGEYSYMSSNAHFYGEEGYYPQSRELPYSSIKGITKHGDVISVVTSTSSSAYPSNDISGSYWYESAGSTTTTSKGSTSYGKVESESSSAYPNGGAQGGYWYENRNSRVDQSIGSYKDAVYSTARNTYPDNGIAGGYWYVFEEV